MTIKYWNNFQKKINSTARPLDSAAVSVSATLKSPTSIENPTFILTGDNFNINYVEAFGHYYFVNDVVSVRNGMIEVSCTQEVLYG